MKLCLESLKDRAAWEAAGIEVPSYDVAAAIANTKANPEWVHFGVGNIFRIFGRLWEMMYSFVRHFLFLISLMQLSIK